MCTPAYQARFVWKPAIVRPPGKVVRVDELQTQQQISSTGSCSEIRLPEEASNGIVPPVMVVAANDADDVAEVIRPAGRIVRVGGGEQLDNAADAAAQDDDDALLPVANCPGHYECMCCLLLKLEERVTQSTIALNQLYAALHPLRVVHDLHLDTTTDEEEDDYETSEPADSVYGSSEELDYMDASIHSDVSNEDHSR